MSFHKSFASGTDTSDATAEQWDIRNGKTAYIASGKVTGSGYFPAMMEFDGSTGYYSHTTYTSSGNKVTGIARFSSPSFTTSYRWVCIAAHGSPARARMAMAIGPSDAANVDERGKLVCYAVTSAGTSICRLISNTSVNDSVIRTAYFAFDADAGTAILRINGIDEDNTSAASRVAPTTGTLSTGSSSSFVVGGNLLGANLLTGSVGFVGHRDAYLTNWSDFMQTDGTPKQISEASASPQWAEWGGQPLFWHESGKMDENKGSAGAMVHSGSLISPQDYSGIILAPASSWS